MMNQFAFFVFERLMYNSIIEMQILRVFLTNAYIHVAHIPIKI